MKKSIWAAMLTVLLFLLCALPVFANAAEPPCFTILVNGAPEDLEIFLVRADGKEERLPPEKRGWETYFCCDYYYNIERGVKLEFDDVRQSSLRIVSGDVDVTMPIPVELVQEYNTVFALQWPEMELEKVYLFWRTPLLVTMRVLITLVVEGLLLWLFGYRQKRTWIIFLCVNLVTQTLLNLSLTGIIPPHGYWWFAYIFGEVLVFIAEAAAYMLLFREKGKVQALVMALLANGISMALGGWILSNLPL
ncbi:MAG: hypothetical protein IJ480_05770 [Clostridia bacterium]|nr:hypothetical protein [Clostridia bacterium]